MGLHHIAIIVSSEKCLDFYKAFGFVETLRKERERDTVVLLKGYGVMLEIFIDPRHPKRLTPEPLGLRHFALKVDDIEKAARGCVIQTDWIGERFCFVTDPDGNQIELHE